jgi:transglutaminase-like putative cysteine protease
MQMRTHPPTNSHGVPASRGAAGSRWLPRPSKGALGSLLLSGVLLLVGCDVGPPPNGLPLPGRSDDADALTPAPTPTNSEPVDNALSDVWYERAQNGQRAGWTHVVWTPTEVNGQPAIHAASTRLMGRVRNRFVSRTLIDLDRTVEGHLLRLRRVVLQGRRQEVTHQSWTGSGYRFVHAVAGTRDERTIACESPLPVDTETFLGALIQAGEVQPGKTFRYQIANFLSERLDDVELEIEGLETLSLPTGTVACWRAIEQVSGRPDKAQVWVDTDGVLRKMVREGTTLLATTQSRARALSRHGVTYSITEDAVPHLPRCTSAERSVVDIEFRPRPGVELPDFPTTPFSREIKRSDQVVRLELTAHDDPEATVALPVTDTAFAEWLRPTTLLCADAPLVQSTLKRLIDGETDGRQIALKLLEFSYTKLTKQSGPIPSPTAVEILEDGRGDCSEHNVLFVTLCRAAGLPARRLSGYAQVGDNWGAHAFCEVWLGKWIGADPTTNELGTRARYVAFGWNDTSDSFPDLVSTRAQGRMSFRTRLVQEGGETVDFDQPLPRDPLREPYSGLRFAPPPEGWRVRISGPAGSARIDGPSVRCDVTVHAGTGNVPADLLLRTSMRRGNKVRFGGLDAVHMRFGRRSGNYALYLIPYKRRALHVEVWTDDHVDEDATLDALEFLLEPTLGGS